MIAFILPLLLCFHSLYGEINWQAILGDFLEQPQNYDHVALSGGASNINYRLAINGSDYCVRMAPQTTQPLYSNLEMEYEVLKLLSHLGVSPKPIYFNRDLRTLITYYIPHLDEPINLTDSQTREAVLNMLRLIEKADVSIPRAFSPYYDTLSLVEKSYSFNAPPLSKEFHELLLPALEQIDHVLAKNPRKSLCHLDLHSKNVLKDQNQFWIIDWEYATMSHPYLVLASMASIERWEDREMEKLLTCYEKSPQEIDFYTLYLYRIVIDIFWRAWNHNQAHCSPIEMPYETWGNLYEKAALDRIKSQTFQDALKALLTFSYPDLQSSSIDGFSDHEKSDHKREAHL